MAPFIPFTSIGHAASLQRAQNKLFSLFTLWSSCTTHSAMPHFCSETRWLELQASSAAADSIGPPHGWNAEYDWHCCRNLDSKTTHQTHTGNQGQSKCIFILQQDESIIFLGCCCLVIVHFHCLLFFKELIQPTQTYFIFLSLLVMLMLFLFYVATFWPLEYTKVWPREKWLAVLRCLCVE